MYLDDAMSDGRYDLSIGWPRQTIRVQLAASMYCQAYLKRPGFTPSGVVLAQPKVFLTCYTAKFQTLAKTITD